MQILFQDFRNIFFEVLILHFCKNVQTQLSPSKTGTFIRDVSEPRLWNGKEKMFSDIWAKVTN